MQIIGALFHMFTIRESILTLLDMLSLNQHFYSNDQVKPMLKVW